MKTFTLSFLVNITFWLFLLPSLNGQSNDAIPLGIERNLSQESLPVIQRGLSADQIAEREQRAGVHKPGTAMFAGFNIDLGIFPIHESKRELVNGNTSVWRIVVHSPGALGLGLVFDAFELKEGERLFVYTPNREVVHGPFNSRNNSPSGIITTPISAGDSLIIEFQAPYRLLGGEIPTPGSFRLNSLIHIVYGGGLENPITTMNIGAAGNCNVNINCPEGLLWQQQKRGVARMLMRVGLSWFWCTGTLINNTRNDGAMLFLTAHHCGVGASESDMQLWRFYFNFEHPGCANEGIPPTHMLTGSELLASAILSNGSDFRLLRLTQSAPREWNLFWNGWDRREDPSSSGVTIHHPGGDVKKISTYLAPTIPATPQFTGQTMAPNAAWRVFWSPTTTNHGVTEAGSSGSPLFNAEGLVIGTLSGGLAACGNNHLQDYYGRFSHHWDKNGTHHTVSLAPHLDPLGTGAITLSGFDPNQTSIPNPQENQVPLASLYPNPAAGMVYIRFSKNLPFADISLLNVNGSQVHHQHTRDIQAGDRIMIPLHGFTQGVYFFRIYSRQATEVLRLVIVN